ncbi:MAG TPA: efflux RND transporter periplasmic adaptor subunit, partial [Polyangiaceae bacterium]|nr:efflux RND transporter periplasmic adaptor subunit [Polyangiaceae bacterium]
SALKIDRSAPARRGGGGALKTIVVVLLVAAAAGAGWTYGKPYLEAQLFKTEIEVTEVASVSPAQATVELTSTGYVIPQSLSKVAPKVAGKVAKLFVKQGDKVKAGDVLFEIDPSDQKATIATAASQAAAAKARAQTARAQLAEAEQQLQRADQLAREGLGPKSAADDLKARVTSMKEGVNAADADARAAGALISAMNVNLGSFTLKAPISGTIVNKPPEVGEFVGPQPAGIAADMGGVEIADFDSMMVETDVPEQRLGQVKLGGPAEIVLDAYPTKRYRGKAVEIIPKVNRSKATVPVKVAFVDDREGALPEMSARVSFLTAELDAEALKAPPKIIVPGSAVASRGGTKVVFVLQDGQARMRSVRIGPAFGSGFELLEGPAPGTRLIKNPPAELADGQRVKEKAPG